MRSEPHTKGNFSALANAAPSDLRGRSVRGGAVTFGAQGIKFLLQLGSTAILARLLTPNDYGLVAMVLAVFGVALIFRDLGLSAATVQRSEITHAQVSSLFWINAAMGLVMAVVLASSGPVLALFFGEKRLVLVAAALSPLFLLGGVSVQHQALLRRQMRFSALAAVDVASTLAGIVLAVWSALMGHAYWALVVMQVATAFCRTAFLAIACPWLPSGFSWTRDLKPMLSFGGHLTTYNLVNYMARNLDNVLIGWRWGASQLGLYSKAYGLLMLPIQQVNAPIAGVAVPALSRLQADPARYGRYYLRAVKILSLITLPFTVYLVAMADGVILAVLGDQWKDAVPIFGVLGLASLVQPILSTTGWLFVSAGRADRMLRWGLFATAVIVASFFAGLPFGALGVAVSYTAATFLLAWPCLWYATISTSVSTRQVAGVLAVPAGAAIIEGIVLLAARRVFGEATTGVFGLAWTLCLALVVFWGGLCALSRGFGPLDEVRELVRELKASDGEGATVEPTVGLGKSP